jgi:Protein kinase domain
VSPPTGLMAFRRFDRVPAGPLAHGERNIAHVAVCGLNAGRGGNTSGERPGGGGSNFGDKNSNAGAVSWAAGQGRFVLDWRRGFRAGSAGVDGATGADGTAPASELLAGRYRPISASADDDAMRLASPRPLGSGTFSLLVLCEDVFRPGRTVALKIMDTAFANVGRSESAILSTLNAADPSGHARVVRLYQTFEFHGHVCLVLEFLNNGSVLDMMNGPQHEFADSVPMTPGSNSPVPMARVVDQLSRDSSPVNRLTAVRRIAADLLQAIAFLHANGIVHADVVRFFFSPSNKKPIPRVDTPPR